MRTSLRVISSLLSLLVITNVATAANVVSDRKVVVIDAGHGGPKFPGASYGGVREKDLNLQVALRLGKMIEDNMKDVDVVYTRTKDIQFSENLNADLQRRADIANGKTGRNAPRGDLFISIHANAARDAAACGTETLIMGESTLEKSRNEEVLFANNKDEFLDMGDEKTAVMVRAYIQNLQYTYGSYSEALARIVQKNYTAAGRRSRGIKRQPLKVLYATDMPGILTEIGFMSNSAELAYMRSEKGQKELATALYRSVEQYFEFMRGVLSLDGDASADASDTTPAETEQSPQQQSAAESDSGFTIQVAALAKRLASSSRDFSKEFGKYKNDISIFISSENTKYPYRYCIGRYATADEAREAADKLRGSFKGAFVVKYSGDRIVK